MIARTGTRRRLDKDKKRSVHFEEFHIAGNGSD